MAVKKQFLTTEISWCITKYTTGDPPSGKKEAPKTAIITSGQVNLGCTEQASGWEKLEIRRRESNREV